MIFTYESQSYTQRTVLLDFIAFFACAKEEEQRVQQQHKKNANRNKYISIDRYAPKARLYHVYCIQAQAHILAQTQIPWRVYNSNSKFTMNCPNTKRMSYAMYVFISNEISVNLANQQQRNIK